MNNLFPDLTIEQLRGFCQSIDGNGDWYNADVEGYPAPYHVYRDQLLSVIHSWIQEDIEDGEITTLELLVKYLVTGKTISNRCASCNMPMGEQTRDSYNRLHWLCIPCIKSDS